MNARSAPHPSFVELGVVQAALALSMVCFPAVLFAGAMVPLQVMARRRARSRAIDADRWAFEALAHDLGVGGAHAGPTDSAAL